MRAMKRSKAALLVLLAAFLVLWALRFAYELSREEGRRPMPLGGFVQTEDFDSSMAVQARKNYASAKIVIEQPQAPSQVYEQKYESVADLRSESPDFDGDSGRIKATAASVGAVVQRENSYGLPGSRVLSLSLGVVPESFDRAVEALKAIGELESITVTKTDRTGDWKALEARRLSLEKTRDGLKALRANGGSLSDLVALETKILEIEGQIQELGVSLGDYSEGASLCTVNLSLSEAKKAAAGLRVLRAAVDALGWALLASLGAALACLAAAGAAALGAHAVAKIKAMAAGRQA